MQSYNSDDETIQGAFNVQGILFPRLPFFQTWYGSLPLIILSVDSLGVFRLSWADFNFRSKRRTFLSPPPEIKKTLIGWKNMRLHFFLFVFGLWVNEIVHEDKQIH